MKKKVGIMTFWESQENYGQILQAIAMQIYLDRKGFDAFLINYRKSSSTSAAPHFFDKVRETDWTLLLDPLALRRQFGASDPSGSHPPIPGRDFDVFRSDYLKFNSKTYGSLAELKNQPPQADLYISGSDRVWDYQVVSDIEPHFLRFGHDTVKRISYAASFGQKRLPSEIKEKYRDYLKSFDAISVSDDNSVSLCRQLGFEQVPVLPDPTVLIRRSEWIPYALEDGSFRMSEGRKILIYTTGQQISKTSDSIIQYVSSLPGTITIHISTNENFSGSMHATIPEWLGYFKSTDLVLTNSYHGVIFSTIFNKNFIFIPNNSRSLIDEHIKFFMQKLGLDKRLVITRFKRKWIDQLGSLAIDWVRVNMRLEEWRQQADQFLDLDKILRSPGAASSNGRM